MSTPVVWEVSDGRGKPVRLREKQWQHIVDRHPEMVDEQEAIRLTISDPDVVVRPGATSTMPRRPPNSRARPPSMHRPLAGRPWRSG